MNRGAAQSICSLKYSNEIPNEITIIFHKFSRRIWRAIYIFRGRYWKIQNLFISNKKEIKRISKNIKKKKLYLTDNNLMTAQGLGQGHFQILLIISQKEFIKLNLNTGMIMGSVKIEELNTTIVSVFFNTQALNI